MSDSVHLTYRGFELKVTFTYTPTCKGEHEAYYSQGKLCVGAQLSPDEPESVDIERIVLLGEFSDYRYDITTLLDSTQIDELEALILDSREEDCQDYDD